MKTASSSIKIKPYTDSHKDQLIKMILTIQTLEFSVPITLKDQPDLNDISNFYIKNNGNFWVASEDNKVIGTIALLDIGNQQCALRKMFVAEEYRGKEKGIAKKLLDVLIKWSSLKAVKEIYLGTVASYHAAHKFYEKNGFVQIKKDELPATFPIMAVDTKFYLYKLPND